MLKKYQFSGHLVSIFQLVTDLVSVFTVGYCDSLKATQSGTEVTGCTCN